MAVKIPQYESRLTPGGFDQAQFNPAPMAEQGAGLRRAGEMMVDAAGAWREAQDRDTLLDSHSKILNVKQEMESWITNDARTNPDLVNDPHYPDRVKAEWNKRYGDAFKDVQMSDRVKHQVDNMAMQIGDSFFTSENSFAATERVNTRLYQIGTIQDSYTRYAIQNPESFDYVMQGMDGVIDNAQLSQSMKIKLKADARDAIALQTIQAIKETKPEMADKILKSIYRTDHNLDLTDLQVDPSTEDQSNWEKRADGTSKGTGWLGLLRRPDGRVSSEISVGVEMDGKEVQIPTLVPTLTKDEVNTMLKLKDTDKVPEPIMKKAVDFARARMAQGLSPFAGPNDTPKYGGATATPNTAAKGDFNSAVSFVLRDDIEGGYRKNDGNGYPVNYGINGKAHPGVDIKNLTKDQAAEIYKRDYWDKIGGDKLPADVATVAFDAAVNQGVTYAKTLLQKSGGDVDKMIEMRRADYQALADKDQSKKKFINGWMTRLDKLQGEVSNMATTAPATTGEASSAPTMAPKVSVEDLPDWAKSLARDIKPQNVPSLIASTEAELNRRKAEAKANVINLETNHLRMAEDGKRPDQMLTIEDYTAAFGADDGANRFENYRKAFVLGDDRKAVSTMTDQQQNDLLAKYAPDPNRPENYGVARDRRDILAKAINDVRTERQKDPMLFALRNNIGGVQPLTELLNKGGVDLANEITRRAAVADTLRDTYQLKGNLLTNDEAAALHAKFLTMDGNTVKAWLKSFSSTLKSPTSYFNLMQQIAPDRPVTAYAGGILQSSFPLTVDGKTYTADKVATKLIRGEQLLYKSTDDKKKDGQAVNMPMPKETELKKAFNGYVGNAFDSQTAWDIGYQSFKAYYAASSEEARDFKDALDGDRADEAVRAVIGDVLTINGTKIIPPWGMSATRFKDELKGQFDKAMTANKYTGGMYDQFEAMNYLPYADPTGKSFDNMYVVENGGRFVTGRDGKTIVLRIPQLEAGPAVPNHDPAPASQDITVPRVDQKADKSTSGKFKTK